jgi:hypothetical protein
MAPARRAVAEGVVGEDLKREVGDLRTEMRTEFATVRGEMRGGFAALRGDMHAEFASVRGDTREGFATLRGDIAHDRFVLLKWSFGFWLAQVFAIGSFIVVLLRAVGR